MAKQTGFMMLVLALILVVIAGLAAAFVTMIVNGTNSSTSMVSANTAYDLAYSGIEKGTYSLLQGTCSSSSSSVVVPNKGEYQYSCNSYVQSTTTTSVLTVSSTSIPVSSTTSFAPFGAVTIDSETIYYSGISGNSLLNARRGKNGSTASTHLLGARVTQNQYIITSQGAVPSLSIPSGMVTLSQAAFNTINSNYFASGTNGVNAVILNYNGASWSSFTGLPGLILYGIEVSSSYGQAVGYNLSSQSYVYTYNGSVWSLTTGPVTSGRFVDVSCNKPSNPTDCWVSGQGNSPNRPYFYHSGISYVPGTGSNFMVNGVYCGANSCVGVGNQNAYNFSVSSTAPFNASFTNLQSTMMDVGCATATSCVGVSSTGSVFYYNGSWSSTRYAISTGPLNSVSCPSTTNCIVAGNSGRIYNCSLPITSTASCSVQATPGTLNISDVYCSATNDCLAVGAGTTAYRYIGGVWTSVTLPASYTLYSVSGTAATGTTSGVVPTVFMNQ